jgi:truncated hemoglobin YjbI
MNCMTSSVESEQWAATESFYGRVLEDDTLRPFFKKNRYGALARPAKHVYLHASRRTSRLYGKRPHAREHGLDDRHFDRFLGHFREAPSEVGVQADKVEKVTKPLEVNAALCWVAETASGKVLESSSWPATHLYRSPGILASGFSPAKLPVRKRVRNCAYRVEKRPRR